MTDIVEAQWQRIRPTASGPTWLVNSFTALVQAAYEEPRLRRLYPWTGMWELHFSRCTEPRFTWDIPYAAPLTGGGYRVDGPSRSQHIGEAATAHEAVALVVERLPSGCGRAFIGTAAELKQQERAQADG
ncbi:DUF6193 family natural product biosynthesis protein [Streptomyces sp. UG1]|uniref:DUF6193 family natural product biosynthesis protein n=1 Tax=Streptomyces sp. UG1 TaxID=3417652 RepID=UPI003CF589B8